MLFAVRYFSYRRKRQHYYLFDFCCEWLAGPACCFSQHALALEAVYKQSLCTPLVTDVHCNRYGQPAAALPPVDHARVDCLTAGERQQSQAADSRVWVTVCW